MEEIFGEGGYRFAPNPKDFQLTSDKSKCFISMFIIL